MAGANRPKNQEDFYLDNVDYTERILSILKKIKKSLILYLAQQYRQKKALIMGLVKQLQKKIIEFGKKFKSKFYIFRLQNIFGKWAKPNYNSVVATFCNNIASSKSINIHDPDVVLELVYIDDLCDEFIRIVQNKPKSGYKKIKKSFIRKNLEKLQKNWNFKNSRSNLISEKVGGGFDRALYSTYLSVLTSKKFNYKLDVNIDERGVL